MTIYKCKNCGLESDKLSEYQSSPLIHAGKCQRCGDEVIIISQPENTLMTKLNKEPVVEPTGQSTHTISSNVQQQESIQTIDWKSMTKLELDNYASSIGINLDKRKSLYRMHEDFQKEIKNKGEQ
jgi:DNA-directed RNA polymerase subunit RPC12/RpoP